MSNKTNSGSLDPALKGGVCAPTSIKALDFWTDGLVFRTIDNREYIEAGSVGPDPRMAVAFKYPPEATVTTVTAVDFDVGATGTICPRAILDPVMNNGTTVTFATLHNFENITKLDLAIGDKVEIQKAGEIIPKVIRVVEKGAHRLPIVKPEHCPCCKNPTAQKETEEGEGVHLVCTNLLCGARVASSIKRWFAGHGVLGIGDVLATKLAEKARNIPNVYTLTEDDWNEITGSSVVQRKLVNQIASKASHIELRDFLRYASIPTVGDNKSLKLADTFLTFDKISAATEEQLVACLGAAGKRVFSYVTEMRAELTFLAAVSSVKPHVVKEDKTAGLPGICITGELSISRDRAQVLIDGSGKFKFTSSVTKVTKYVIVGSDPGKAKIEAAKKKSLPLLDEAGLMDLLQG